MSVCRHPRFAGNLWRALAIAIMLAPSISGRAAAESLTLAEAISKAARHDPTLALTAALTDAARADVRQAAFGPRPSVGIDVEEFAGTGPYSPFNRSQTTLSYAQTWERGGKRAARANAAKTEIELARMAGRLRSLDRLAETQAAWIDAAAADLAVSIAAERLASAEWTERETARRVARALDPLFAGERARTAVLDARIAHARAVEDSRIARATLGTWWNGNADFTIDTTAFLNSVVETAVSMGSPDLQLLVAERQAAEARVQLQQTEDDGDPTLNAGVRHNAEGDDIAFVVGASIPLGNRNANRNRVDRARATLRASEAAADLSRIENAREITMLTASRAALTREINRIDAEILPSAERAVRLVRDGFNRGGTAFTFTEVSETQRALTEARARRIELLRTFHLQGARLDRIAGRHTPLLSNEETY